MTSLRSLAFAGLAAAALLTTVGVAEAGRYRPGGVGSGPLGPGLSLNFGLAPPANPSYPQAPYPGYPLYPRNYGRVLAPPPPPLSVYPAYPMTATEAHSEWCGARYHSYNPATDTFTGYDGLAHRCAAPY